MADISKISLPDGSSYDIKDPTKQPTITASGVLVGDGSGGITAATKSDITDLGIPSSISIVDWTVT